ncbi:hypothetical protein ACFL55_01530 [Candidatus Latescibacterota bacterium]
MKKVLTLMLVSTLVLAAGCLTDSGDDNKDNGDSTTLSAADYLPLETGSIWMYNDTDTDYSQSPPDVDISTSSMTCTGQETINGKTYWALVETDSDEPFFLRIDNNDVYGIDVFEDILEKPALKGLQEEGEMLLFRFGVSAGTTWEIWSYSYSEDQYSWSITMSGKYLGTESVTVPADSYSNCAKFEITTTSSYSYGGYSLPETGTSKTTMWFAPDVGPIKTIDDSTYEDIIDYTYESVLTSYTPGGSATPQ